MRFGEVKLLDNFDDCRICLLLCRPNNTSYMLLKINILCIMFRDRQNAHSLSIGDLLEGVMYMVRVQALSRAGPGQVASIHFTTPLLQLVPVGKS